MNYLFYNAESGENFFAQADNLNEAWEIVKEYFEIENIKYVDEYTDAQADALGFDTF